MYTIKYSMIAVTMSSEGRGVPPPSPLYSVEGPTRPHYTVHRLQSCSVVLFLLEEHFESVLGIKLLAGFEPGESRFFAGGHLTLTSLEKGKNVLSI